MTTLTTAQKMWEAFAVAASGHEYEPKKGLAAALRAAADQVAPDEPDYMRAAIHDQGWWDKHDLIRSEILDIADELEANR